MTADSPPGGSLDLELVSALERAAQQPKLLVVFDYDGTLAPIVADPTRAFPSIDAVDVLLTMAELPDTHVAVLSGRSIQALATLYEFPPQIHVVGSHGSEFSTGFDQPPDPTQIDLLQLVGAQLEEIAAAHLGFIVERKPASVALHYRNAPPDIATTAVTAVRDGPAALPGVHVKAGKQVIELAVVRADKGTALDRLRAETGADVVIFVGDDITDEDAFAVLRPGDVGIKVGDGATLATHRISGQELTATVLERLLELRLSWCHRQP